MTQMANNVTVIMKIGKKIHEYNLERSCLDSIKSSLSGFRTFFKTLHRVCLFSLTHKDALKTIQVKEMRY